MSEDTKTLYNSLDYAKGAVRSCLDNADTSVDMHGLEYWAGEVERLRGKIKERL